MLTLGQLIVNVYIHVSYNILCVREHDERRRATYEVMFESQVCRLIHSDAKSG